MVQEAQVVPQLLLEIDGGEGVLVHQIPLVDHQDHGRAGLLGVAGDHRVLMGDPLHRVDQQQGNVGPGHRLLGLEDRQLFRAFVGLALAPDPGGIDEPVDPVVHMEHGVHRIPGGAGHVAHQAALVAQQPVGQGGLAHVGPADHGEPQLFGGIVDLRLLLGAVERQLPADARQQFGHRVPVAGRDHVDLVEAQLVEGPVRGSALHAVDLVHHQDGRLAHDPDPGGDLSVGGVPAVPCVHHEHHDVGLLHGRLGDAGDALGDDVAPFEIQAAGVHQFEQLLGVPHLRQASHPAVAPVPGHARQIVHQRGTGTGEAIEERGLPDIGASTKGYERKFHGATGKRWAEKPSIYSMRVARRTGESFRAPEQGKKKAPRRALPFWRG